MSGHTSEKSSGIHKPSEDLWQILDEGMNITSSTLLECLKLDDDGTTAGTMEEDEVDGRTTGASALNKVFADVSESFGTSEYASAQKDSASYKSL